MMSKGWYLRACMPTRQLPQDTRNRLFPIPLPGTIHVLLKRQAHDNICDFLQ